MKTGIQIIVNERAKHTVKHGYDADHDDKHVNGEMLDLAKYLMSGKDSDYPYGWEIPIKSSLFKKNRIEQLGIAGLMIAAEIDRLKRLKGKE